MKYWNKICALSGFFFLTCLGSRGQGAIKFDNGGVSATNNMVVMAPHSPVKKKELIIFPGSGVYDLPSPQSRISVLPGDYYTQHFGFFCKRELALEKATKIPFRFRLGSLQQCNMLEGKSR